MVGVSGLGPWRYESRALQMVLVVPDGECRSRLVSWEGMVAAKHSGR